MSPLTRRSLLRVGSGTLAAAALAPSVSGCSASADQSTVLARPEPTRSPALPAFDPDVPAGRPTGLPSRIAWANTSDVGIFAALGAGMRTAGEDAGLEYLTANAEGDPQRNADQIRTFLARGIAGMTIQPLNPAAQQPLMQEALDRGVCVVGIINHPCTIQVAARQYDIGLQQGRAAARYIVEELGGRATVFNANLNEIAPQLELRNQGVLAGLEEAGDGVEVIDTYVSSGDQTPERVFALITTELQRHPEIKVVLGVDGFVLPAYRAFQQTGRLTDDMYFASIDGAPEVLEFVGQGGPYRAAHAFAWSLMGYGMGRFVADWAAGRPVPRAMVAEATLVDSPAKARRFLADAAAPRATFEDRERYGTYLPLLGNVRFEDADLQWTDEYQP